MTAYRPVLDGKPSLAATVVQQACKSSRTCFKFYCMFYFTCDRSFSCAYKAGSLRTPRLSGAKPTYRPLPHKCETHITSVYHLYPAAIVEVNPAGSGGIRSRPSLVTPQQVNRRRARAQTSSRQLFKAVLAADQRSYLSAVVAPGTDGRDGIIYRPMRTGGSTLDPRVPVDSAGLSALLSGDVCGDGGSAVIPGCDDDDTGVGDSTTATNKKGANMTERVPVPSSEHVAEIVGRQGKFVQVRWSAVGLIDTEFRDAG